MNLLLEVNPITRLALPSAVVVVVVVGVGVGVVVVAVVVVARVVVGSA